MRKCTEKIPIERNTALSSLKGKPAECKYVLVSIRILQKTNPNQTKWHMMDMKVKQNGKGIETEFEVSLNRLKIVNQPTTTGFQFN